MHSNKSNNHTNYSTNRKTERSSRENAQKGTQIGLRRDDERTEEAQHKSNATNYNSSDKRRVHHYSAFCAIASQRKPARQR